VHARVCVRTRRRSPVLLSDVLTPRQLWAPHIPRTSFLHSVLTDGNGDSGEMADSKLT
jgi:hypothetical protein